MMIGGLEASCKALMPEFNCDIWILSLLHEPIRRKLMSFSAQSQIFVQMNRLETD